MPYHYSEISITLKNVFVWRRHYLEQLWIMNNLNREIQQHRKFYFITTAHYSNFNYADNFVPKKHKNFELEKETKLIRKKLRGKFHHFCFRWIVVLTSKPKTPLTGSNTYTSVILLHLPSSFQKPIIWRKKSVEWHQIVWKELEGK